MTMLPVNIRSVATCILAFVLVELMRRGWRMIYA